MRNGEMAQDRWGRWHYPLDQIASAFRQPQVATRYGWTHCPFCNEQLPNTEMWLDPPDHLPPAEAGGDDQADGN